MPTREKILDDLASLAGGAAGLASTMTRQIREEIRTRVDDIILRMDFVPRAEFERLEALCQKTRMEQEKLEKRLQALEKPQKTQKKTPPPKPAKTGK